MKQRLDKLLTVKSIVTIVLTGVVSYLAIVGKIGSTECIAIYTTIIGFYFGTQSQKQQQTGGDAE